MNSKQTSRLAVLLALGVVSSAVVGCSGSSSGGNGSGGAGVSNGSGGATSTGGISGSGGATASGGSEGSGGLHGSGGALGSGGSNSGGVSGTGGSTATGGVATGGVVGGTGGVPGGVAGAHGGGSGGTLGSGGAAGGATGSGGRSSTGGAAGSPAGSGGGGGSSGSGSCQKGQVKAAEVVIMGESFYAIDPQYIQNRIQDDARKAGSLAASDKYRNVAVSGQNMNYIATTEWTAATQGGASVKDVIMDGGGIDCLTGGTSCPTCASTFKTLLGKMATAGVQDVIYTRYPEPGNPPGSNAALKTCLDATMPGMQTTCEGSTSPRCHFLDLRPVWKDGDTTDGLHPTQSGGEHVGDLIWSEMMKDCFAQ